ncbi:MAG: alpha/beta hydrolase domain-containing protein, partial [Dehalococcoidia bacterium]
FNSSPDRAPSEPLDPGDGLLMRRGYTVVWCGWQHDVPDVPGLLRIQVPGAEENGRPVSGRLALIFQPNATTPVKLLSDRLHLPYPTNDVSDAQAVLTVQDHDEAAPQVISKDKWSFAKLETGQIVPSDQHIYLESGFQGGRVYQLIYSTTGAPVIGLGFLSVRDLVSFLRYSTEAEDNPCADGIDHAYSFGASQSGGYLRQFIHLGVNQDEADQPVFDGIISHIAGGRTRNDLNQRFSQPSDAGARTLGSVFPFADLPQTDPETGARDGLLSRLLVKGEVPKIFFTNSAAEYWRGHAALIHTDVTGTKDIDTHDAVRIYHFAGTQHQAGSLPLTDGAEGDGPRGEQLLNIVNYRPLLRGLLDRLDQWVTEGIEPPASRHPRLEDGTAVLPDQLASVFGSFPGVNFPQHFRRLRRLDFQAEKGVVHKLPPEVGQPYPNLVSAVDPDGNELGGIRLPDLTVPLGTHAGWNLRHPDCGGVGQTIGLSGATIPFPSTREEREQTGDPRLSIEERYPSRQDYLSQVRRAAEALVAEGYLLPEDIENLLRDAGDRYDALRHRVREAQAADN